MTLPLRRAVIRPRFASIADTLREEFANKGLQLYENIYRMAGNFGGEFILADWRIGGFESNPPIFHPPKTSQCDVIIIAKS